MNQTDNLRDGEDAQDVAVSELLEVDRDLTEEEENRLAAFAEKTWGEIQGSVASRARAAYSVAPEETFRSCVRDHMDLLAWNEMIGADVYTCPVCATLLKDRRTVVASAVLIERARIREMWKEYEAAEPGPVREGLRQRLSAALGGES